MLDQILGSTKDTILQSLTSKLGLSSNQAGGFLQKALSLLETGITSGKVNPTELDSGDPSSILSKLDLGQLSSFTGGDTGKARTGMEAILGHIMSFVKSSGGAKALMSNLTAGAGAGGGSTASQVGGMFGKVFGGQRQP
jgi:hypothetical protein